MIIIIIKLVNKLLQIILPHHLVSYFSHFVANIEVPFIKNSLNFIFKTFFRINLKESVISNYKEFSSLNDMFIRKIRMINDNLIVLQSKIVLSPVNGMFIGQGQITKKFFFLVKHYKFTLNELLGIRESALYNVFQFYAIIYLAPHDYHRVHMPLHGQLKKMAYVPGMLYSVNKYSFNNVHNLYSKNERIVCYFDNKDTNFIIVLVGAMAVGSIETTWHGIITPPHFDRSFSISYDRKCMNIFLNQCEEIGMFKFGSTVIMFFKNHIIFNKDCINKKIHVGTPLGRFF